MVYYVIDDMSSGNAVILELNESQLHLMRWLVEHEYLRDEYVSYNEANKIINPTEYYH